MDENPTYQEVAVNCVPLRFVNTVPLIAGNPTRVSGHIPVAPFHRSNPPRGDSKRWVK
jgi:hypothetical protein